jgi:5-methylcytosine-specific restriction endonuclease McrA
MSHVHDKVKHLLEGEFMASNKQGAANLVVRAILNFVGEKRDLAALGLPPGELRGKKLKARLLAEFESSCAYCGIPVGEGKAEAVIDHLVPMNKTSVGLHQLGNLVLACDACNSSKASKSLSDFLAERPDLDGVGVSMRLMRRRERLGANLDSTECVNF